MQHFIGILAPSEQRPAGEGRQKPFFGPEWRLSAAERDAALLSGKWPGEAIEPNGERRDTELRFVSLLSPPFI